MARRNATGAALCLSAVQFEVGTGRLQLVIDRLGGGSVVVLR